MEVEVFAEFENGQLVSQMATSDALEKINREIIESIKFRFIEQGIIERQYGQKETNMLDLSELQNDLKGKPWYHSEEQLIEGLLKNEKVRHYRQLRYLANKHDRSVINIRFVLNPFSFVFLLTGEEKYHVVLETLDTEEATYIWHIIKNVEILQEQLKSIERDFNIIRNQGRQFFLETQPINFSRIFHDYSDERKGFVVWKDQLEERLI